MDVEYIRWLIDFAISKGWARRSKIRPLQDHEMNGAISRFRKTAALELIT
jgi:hypothetical protein